MSASDPPVDFPRWFCYFNELISNQDSLDHEVRMTRHLQDESGRRWKAWLASRDVFWPDPKMKKKPDDREAILFVCFSDPTQPQRRIQLPAGSFDEMSAEDLMSQFLVAKPDPEIR